MPSPWVEWDSWLNFAISWSSPIGISKVSPERTLDICLAAEDLRQMVAKLQRGPVYQRRFKMPDNVAMQPKEAEVQLTLREKETLLELLDIAIEDTLTNASVFEKHAEIRHGYHQRVNCLIALFQKIECSHRLHTYPKPLPTL